MMFQRLLPLPIFLFFSFLVFSILVQQDLLDQWDFDTTVKLQDALPHFLDTPFSLLSLFGMAEITGLVWLIIWTISIAKKAWQTVRALLSFWLGLFIELLLKIFIDHPGPPFLFYRGVINLEFPSHYVHTGYAYPSGHMMRSAFLITFLIVLTWKKGSPSLNLFLQPLLLLLLASMAISRVYLGEHWASDVIGGGLLGISLGLFTAATLKLRR